MENIAQRLETLAQENLKKRDNAGQFDSIVVGRCSGVPGLCYKLIDLHLACKDENPLYTRITKIDSGDPDDRYTYKFILSAKTTPDFSKYEEANDRDLVIAIAPLSIFEGDIYSSEKKLLRKNQHIIIGCPRAIVVGDGRIFVERNFKDFDTWKYMPEIIQTSAEFFKESKFYSLSENSLKN